MSDATTDDKLNAMGGIYSAARTLWIWGLTTERPDDAVKRFVEMNPDVKGAFGGCTCEPATQASEGGVKP